MDKIIFYLYLILQNNDGCRGFNKKLNRDGGITLCSKYYV